MCWGVTWEGMDEQIADVKSVISATVACKFQEITKYHFGHEEMGERLGRNFIIAAVLFAFI